MTTSPSTSSAIVFKEYSDIYNSAIERARFRPIFVPVLNSIHGDIDELARVMSDGAGAYDGVVVTSQRAVEAWKSAAEVAQNAPSAPCGSTHSYHTQHSPQLEWSDLPFYSVGPSTSHALRSLGKCTCPHLTPKYIMGGEESGNGVKLADYILSNHKDGNDKKHNRILYLVGDKTASELSNILQDNGVLVDRLQVYATKRLSVEQLQFNIHKANAGDAKWIIIFSPSGADVIIPAIKEMELNVKVACIGPTTSKYVQEIMQVCVDAVPAKPDAQLLAEAMSRVD